MLRQRKAGRFTQGKRKGMRPAGKKTTMNKQESNYATHLRHLAETSQIVDWMYEPFGLRLAQYRCHYHPDFFVTYEDHFEVHEVKAFSKKTGKPRWEDDAIIKFKVAANLFPYWKFKIVYFNSVKQLWEELEF